MALDDIIDKIKGFGAMRLLMVAGASLGVMALLVMLFMRVGKPEMTALYQGVDTEDNGKVLEQLSRQGIHFEVRDGGVFVPSGSLLSARMSLAEAGLPGNSLVGYELFDQSDVLGSSHFVQNVNLLRALEGELARTIQTIQAVAKARVHIVMPERPLFSKDRRQPSAAVVIRMRQGRKMDDEQVSAVRHLIASSVPDLKVSQVSILDDRGKLLASDQGEKEGSEAKRAEGMRGLYEARLGRMIESMLEQSLGVGSVRVEVSAEIDLDRVTEQSEVFDPEGQVVRSQQNNTDSSKSSSGGASPTTVQQELPNIQQGAGQQGGEGSESQKAEETINYEISKTVRTAVKEMGGIKRLSVAVLVDGVHTKNDSGEDQYQERSEEDLAKIRRLVQAAMGFNEKRGDALDVVNLRFQREDVPELSEEGWMPRLTQEHMMRLIEMLVLAAVVLVLFFFGVKPYLMKASAAKSLAVDMVGDNADTQKADESADTKELEEENLDEDVSKLRGWQKLPDDEILMLVNKFIQTDPERAVSILRLWIKE